MQELLAPEPCSRDEAFARCERFLRGESRAWRLLRLGIPAERRGELCALLAWHRILRAALPARRADLARELEHVLAEAPETPLGTALAACVGRFALPANLLRGPFLALEGDERVSTFTTRGEMLAHVRRLAVPEGRLLLRVLGTADERGDALADALATGLQLAAWTVDLRGELARGRLRVPAEDLARFDVLPQALVEGRDDEGVRRLVASQVAWAREHLARGWPLCRTLGPRTGRALTFVLRWHAASLASLEARGFVPPERPPRAGLLRALACAAAAATTAPPRLA